MIKRTQSIGLVLAMIMAFIMIMPNITASTWNSTYNQGLKYYWGMEDGSGTSITDLVEAKNLVAQNAPDSVWNTSCIHGNCITLGATTYEFNTTTAIDGGNNPAAFTISYWAKRTSVTAVSAGYETIFSTTNTGAQPFNDGEFFISTASSKIDGIMRISVSNGAGGYTMYNLSLWQHIVYVVANNTPYQVWLNGRNIFNSTENIIFNDFSPTQPFTLFENSIAGLEDTTYMGIDEVAIWNRTLSRSEVVDLYNGGTGIFYNASTPAGPTDTNLTSCSLLSQSNHNYYLTANINTADYASIACFNITGSNVTLDMAGYKITGESQFGAFNSTTWAIYSVGKTNITIKNGIMHNLGDWNPVAAGGIYLKNVRNSFIINSTYGSYFTSGSGYGLRLVTCNNINVSKYKIDSSNGVSIIDSTNNNLYDVEINAQKQILFENGSNVAGILSYNNTFYNVNTTYGVNQSTLSSSTLFIENTTGFLSKGNRLVFRNAFGEIIYSLTGNMNGTWDFGRTIKLSDNRAYVNSSTYIAGPISGAYNLNMTANVTLYNLLTNYTLPSIYRDGAICLNCYNFTSLNAGNVIFNVSSWTAYTIGETEWMFGFCNSTLTSPVLNLTFYDETTGASLFGSITSFQATYYVTNPLVTKSYYFSNLTANPSYAFCAQPITAPMYIDLNIQYTNNSGYSVRTYSSSANYTNTTTNINLALLSSSLTQFVTFSTFDSTSGIPIEGVAVNVYTNVLGVSTLVTSGMTDSAGGVLFQLNPLLSYDLTFTKAGYTTNNKNVNPSLTAYSIYLVSATPTATGTGGGAGGTSAVPYNNITYTGYAVPAKTWFKANESMVFIFNATTIGSTSNYGGSRMEIWVNSTTMISSFTKNKTGTTTSINMTGNCSNYGQLIVKQYIYNNSAVINYTLVLTNHYTCGLTIVTGNHSLVKGLDAVGDITNADAATAFTFGWWTFFFLAVIIAGVSVWLNLSNGYGVMDPTVILVGLTMVFWGLSFADLIPLPGMSDSWIAQYGLAFELTLFSIARGIRVWRER